MPTATTAPTPFVEPSAHPAVQAQRARLASLDNQLATARETARQAEVALEAAEQAASARLAAGEMPDGAALAAAEARLAAARRDSRLLESARRQVAEAETGALAEARAELIAELKAAYRSRIAALDGALAVAEVENDAVLAIFADAQRLLGLDQKAVVGDLWFRPLAAARHDGSLYQHWRQVVARELADT
jgi:hypothetical protein